MTDAALPEPDRVPGAPHPRETPVLFGQDMAQSEFLAAFGSGRVHSGWLITGPPGIGKATLAWKIATFLLADPGDAGEDMFGAPPPPSTLALDPDHPDARLVQSGAHPRLFVVRRPVDDKGTLKTEITVDAVRPLKQFFHMSAADGGRRVVIVDAADELNRSAANAILKELEEPPACTTILLIAHQPSRLLPTIRSRCRVLRCAPLDGADLGQALDQAGFEAGQQAGGAEALAALAEGSPGAAIRLLGHDGLAIYAELVKLAEAMPNMPRGPALKLADSCVGRPNADRFALVLDLLDRLLSRVARAGALGEPGVQAAPGEARALTRLAPTPDAARGWADLQQQLSARMRHGRAVNLDPAALILDTLLAIEATARGHIRP